MTANFWWVLGVALMCLEMASGAFYLLVLGIAALLTGALTLLGVGEELQYACAALLAVVGILGVNRLHATRSLGVNTTQNMDVGQPVTLTEIDGNTLRVRYRGTEWQALSQGAFDPDKPLFIQELRGNVLVVGHERHA